MCLHGYLGKSCLLFDGTKWYFCIPLEQTVLFKVWSLERWSKILTGQKKQLFFRPNKRKKKFHTYLVQQIVKSKWPYHSVLAWVLKEILPFIWWCKMIVLHPNRTEGTFQSLKFFEKCQKTDNEKYLIITSVHWSFLVFWQKESYWQTDNKERLHLF